MTDPRPRDGLRASDADREQVVERLRDAHSEGRLDLAELDERTAAAYAARTYGDLDNVTVDLPPVHLPVAPTAVASTQGGAVEERRGSRVLRGVVGAWLTISLINVMIWGIVSVGSAEFVYPWWIWVAGPWGAVILATWISGRATRP